MTYNYRVTDVVRVVDGDTVDLVIDVGFRLHTTQRVRLLNVDTPELRDPDPVVRQDAQKAKQYVNDWFLSVSFLDLRVTTHKSDSFGRWLGDIYVVHPDGSRAFTLTDDLVSEGYATRWVR